MPHIGYKLQLPHNCPLYNLITIHYHHSHTTEIHANIKENTSKYGNKYIEIQIKVELRCPHHLSLYFLLVQWFGVAVQRNAIQLVLFFFISIVSTYHIFLGC